MDILVKMLKNRNIDLGEVENFREKLETLWNQLDATRPDYEQMKTAYIATARAAIEYIGVPAVDYGTTGAINISNKSTGLPIYGIKQTTKEEMTAQITRRDKADRIWAKIPVVGRQAFIREVTKLRKEHAEVFALALMIDTGKPYWSAIGEGVKATDFYIWAGSDEVAREAASIYAVGEDKQQITDIGKISDEATVAIYDKHTTPLPGGASVIESLNYTEALAANDTAVAPVAGDIVAIKPPSDGAAWVYPELNIRNKAYEKWSVIYSNSAWAQDLKTTHNIDISDAVVIETLQEGTFTIGIGHGAKYHLYSGVHRTVGSAETGPFLEGERLEAGNIGPVINELSGINPHVVMPEAKFKKGGLEKYVADGHAGVANNTGARCTAPNPMLAHKDVFDEVKELARAKFEKGTPAGNPFQKWERDGCGEIIKKDDKPVKYNKNGAIMKKVFFDESQAYLQEARDLGLEVVGGERLLSKEHPNAYHMNEALIISENLTPEVISFLRRPKPFGPVTNLVKIENLEQGIEVCKELSGLSMGFYGSTADFAKFRDNVNHGSAHHYEPPKDKSPDFIHAQKGGAGKGITGSVKSVNQYRRECGGESSVTLKGHAAREELRRLADKGLFVETLDR